MYVYGRMAVYIVLANTLSNNTGIPGHGNIERNKKSDEETKKIMK